MSRFICNQPKEKNEIDTVEKPQVFELYYAVHVHNFITRKYFRIIRKKSLLTACIDAREAVRFKCNLRI